MENNNTQSKVKCCDVPADLHGTCCGWENASAPCSAELIIVDKRHPGFGQHLDRWKRTYLDGSEDSYDITEKSSYGSGWDAGYAAAKKAQSKVEGKKPDFENHRKEFINYYVDRREQQGMLSSLSQLYNAYVAPLHSRIRELEQALDEIANPIKYIQLRAEEEGMQINGYMASELSRSASYLKEIAEKALRQPLPSKPE